MSLHASSVTFLTELRCRNFMRNATVSEQNKHQLTSFYLLHTVLRTHLLDTYR